METWDRLFRLFVYYNINILNTQGGTQYTPITCMYSVHCIHLSPVCTVYTVYTYHLYVQCTLYTPITEPPPPPCVLTYNIYLYL